MATNVIIKKDRKKNWSKDEVNVLREEYTKHKAYLQASFNNNNVTNAGKNETCFLFVVYFLKK